MKIAIDCRYLGGSGIGRFLKGILANLDFNKNEYYLIGKEKDIKDYPAKKLLFNDSSAFSIKGILKINKEVNECDIFFSPNFIIPYNVKIKCITVLHDIVFLDMPKINANYIEYKLKKHLLKRCMKKSSHVFTVSNFSKERISYYFKKYETKLSYAYTGVDAVFKKYEKEEALEKENYIIYIGNIKENKGLKTLLEAFKKLRNDNSDLFLYLIGDKDSLKNKDDSLTPYFDLEGIKFTGKISDEELLNLERKAKFLIQPSLYEGFGLPPLEALYLKTKPIISDIDVFKEIYSDLDVDFFKVNDSDDLVMKIKNSNPVVNPDFEYMNKKFNVLNFARIIEEEFN